MTYRSLVAASAFALALLVGCTSIETQRNDWSAYDGPGQEHFLEPEVVLEHPADPAEPTNRKLWAFNRGAYTYVGGPLARGWKAITPKPLRTGLTNFGRNLLFPTRFVNSLLQGKLTGAWNETKRFVVNSTVGVAGLFDVVGDSWAHSNEDFGQTFEAAGWKDSSLFVIPLLGPSTARDTLGLAFDSAIDVLSYFPPASPGRSFNDRADLLDAYARLEKTSFDLYYLAQRLTTVRRKIELHDDVHPDAPCDVCSANQTLQAIFLTYLDPSFPRKRKDRSVKVVGRAKQLPYSLFLQPEPAPVVFIVPGLGTHRLSNAAIGLAEMVYQRGYSAVTISSAMNFEFIETASSADLPGFAPVDAQDVHTALDLINADIEAAYPGRLTHRALMGISLGAFHTLYIAAAESDPENTLISFERYVAINPPVSLEHGVTALDRFYNAPLEYPEEERQEQIGHTLLKAIQFGGGTLTPTVALPFSELEAQFLIGLSFRSTLQDIIWQTQFRKNMGVLKTPLKSNQRSPAYDEIADFSYIEYLYAFVLPHLAVLRDDIDDSEAGARRLFDLCDLRSLESELRANPRIEIVTNDNDFLLAPGDLDWLCSVITPSRCHHFERGGHLGNLYLPEVREEIMDLLKPLLDKYESVPEGGVSQ